MFTVELWRGPLPRVIYKHTTDKAAYRRADALSELHGSIIMHVPNRYVVLADEHYAKAKPAK